MQINFVLPHPHQAKVRCSNVHGKNVDFINFFKLLKIVFCFSNLNIQFDAFIQ